VSPPEVIPAWYRETPAGQADAEERDRRVRELHDRIAAERGAVIAEGLKARLALTERETALREKMEKLRGPFDAAAAAWHEARIEVGSSDRRTDRRVGELNKQLAATADPRLERLAVVLQERCDLLRGNGVDPPDGVSAGALAMQFQERAREVREVVSLLTAAEAAERMAKIIAWAQSTMTGSVASRYDVVFREALGEGTAKP
jgi:hypothetical protein